MKLFTLALACMALALPLGLLLTSGSNGNLMVDRDAPSHRAAATQAKVPASGRDYAAR